MRYSERVDSEADRALIAETLRIYRRYAIEVVEQLNLCPWAERARRDGQVRERVVLTSDITDFGPALEAIAEVAEDCRLEIGLLIFPRLRLPRLEFEYFVGRVREADAKRYELGRVPLAMAAFHPNAPLDTSQAERLIPYLRRSPDPTVQLVRRSTLERMREKTPQGTHFMDVSQLTPAMLSAPPTLTLRQRIASANLETLQAVGFDVVDRLLAEIQADRDASYARLGEL